MALVTVPATDAPISAPQISTAQDVGPLIEESAEAANANPGGAIRARETPAGSVSTRPQAIEARAKSDSALRLRVKSPTLTARVVVDLVSILGGAATAQSKPKGRTKAISLALTLPQDQSGYFFDKLARLGLLSPPQGPIRTAGALGVSHSITLVIYDP